MKSVLLLVHADPGQEARLQAALAVVRAISGQLECLDVTPLIEVLDDGVNLSPGFVAAPPTIVDETVQEQANRKKLQKYLSEQDFPWSWTDVRDDFAPALLAAAGKADVVVLNRKLHGHAKPKMVSLAGSVLIQTEALVLAVGEDERNLDLATPALIAWDGSQPAWHAVQRSVPLLRYAGAVKLVQVGPVRRHAILAHEVVDYLAEQGVVADVDFIDDKDPAMAIQHAVLRHRAGWCVMGAYGHSRLGEALFGGVTRTMLADDGVPLLLAH